MTPLDLVLGLLEPWRKCGGRYVARCPAHGDRTPSLSVSENAAGAVLFHCFAGCAAAEIVASIGLEMKDLFPSSAPVVGDVVAIYEYRYVDGRPAFEIRRYRSKGFRAFLPDGSPGAPTVRPLYRAPEVEASRIAGETIFVCEGEKDADAISAAGFVATTNPFGAKAWTPNHTEALAGARVTVVQDRDAKGRARGQFLTEILTPVCLSVKLVEAASGNDAADHLEAGHTVAEFVPVDLRIPDVVTLRIREAMNREIGLRDLDGPTRKFLQALALHVRPDGQVFGVNQQQLADSVSVSLRTIGTGCRRARELGLVTCPPDLLWKLGKGALKQRLRYDVTPLIGDLSVEGVNEAANGVDSPVRQGSERREADRASGVDPPVRQVLSDHRYHVNEVLVEEQDQEHRGGASASGHASVLPRLGTATAEQPHPAPQCGSAAFEPLVLGRDLSAEQVAAWDRVRQYERDWTDALDEYFRRLANAAAAEHHRKREANRRVAA